MRLNPVFRKELKIGMRTVRMPVIIMIFNTILALISLLVFYSIIENVSWRGRIDYDSVILLYVVMIAIQGVLLAFIVPAVTANTISGERERQTLDILLTSRMSHLRIVTGKLMSSMSMVVLLLISSIPVISLAFMFGGIALMDVIWIIIYLVFAGLIFGLMGVACSSKFKKTTSATVVCYGGIIGLCGGTFFPMLIVVILQNLRYSGDWKPVMGIVALLLLFNPGVTTAIILVRQLAYADAVVEVLHDTFNVPMFFTNHWIVISLIAQVILCAFMLWRAVRNLNTAK